MTSITHIVLFKYRSSVPWVELESHFRAFIQLQHTCLKPNGKPYMISMKMGKNTSWVGSVRVQPVIITLSDYQTVFSSMNLRFHS